MNTKPSTVFKWVAAAGQMAAVGILVFNVDRGLMLMVLSFCVMILSNQYASEERLCEVVDILDKQLNRKGKTP